MNIKTLCLGILHFSDATGYEINKHASDGNFSHFINASYGSIYPALTKMTEEGLVTLREEMESGKPTRKVYSITDKGRQELSHSLTERPRDDIFKSEFLFLTMFGDLIDGERIQSALEAQIRKLTDENERLKSICTEKPDASCQFAIGYGVAINEAAIKYMKQKSDQLNATEFEQHSHAPNLDALAANS